MWFVGDFWLLIFLLWFFHLVMLWGLLLKCFTFFGMFWEVMMVVITSWNGREFVMFIDLFSWKKELIFWFLMTQHFWTIFSFQLEWLTVLFLVFVVFIVFMGVGWHFVWYRWFVLCGSWDLLMVLFIFWWWVIILLFWRWSWNLFLNVFLIFSLFFMIMVRIYVRVLQF